MKPEIAELIENCKSAEKVLANLDTGEGSAYQWFKAMREALTELTKPVDDGEVEGVITYFDDPDLGNNPKLATLIERLAREHSQSRRAIHHRDNTVIPNLKAEIEQLKQERADKEVKDVNQK